MKLLPLVQAVGGAPLWSNIEAPLQTWFYFPSVCGGDNDPVWVVSGRFYVRNLSVWSNLAGSDSAFLTRWQVFDGDNGTSYIHNATYLNTFNYIYAAGRWMTSPIKSGDVLQLKVNINTTFKNSNAGQVQANMLTRIKLYAGTTNNPYTDMLVTATTADEPNPSNCQQIGSFDLTDSGSVVFNGGETKAYPVNKIIEYPIDGEDVIPIGEGRYLFAVIQVHTTNGNILVNNNYQYEIDFEVQNVEPQGYNGTPNLMTSDSDGASASSVFGGGYEAYLAFDNNVSSAFFSNYSDPLWLARDLGEPKKIVAIGLNPRGNNEWPDFDIEVSDSGLWAGEEVTALSVTGAAMSTGRLTYYDITSPVEAQHIRIKATNGLQRFGMKDFRTYEDNT